MRIISGTFGGRTLRLPKGLPARPTTDRAKEALFNILNHRLIWAETDVLDLFSGTGNISLECVSRGARSVTAVERDSKSVGALRQIVLDWEISSLRVLKMDVKSLFSRVNPPFGLIFLDPPYQWDGIQALVSRLLAEDWLEEGGCLVAEHIHSRDLTGIPGWEDTRTYGDSSFSFFGNSKENMSK